jgi:hypothetical protein
MASRVSKVARAKVKGAARDLKAVVKDVAEAARAVANKHGVTRSVTIVKGQTISKDKPTRVIKKA